MKVRGRIVEAISANKGHVVNGLLLSIVMINIMARYVCVYSDYAYFFGDALCWVLAYVVIRLLVKNKTTVIIVEGSFSLILNNLIDEQFFDPTTFGINEFAFTLFILLWVTIRFLKCPTSKQEF